MSAYWTANYDYILHEYLYWKFSCKICNRYDDIRQYKELFEFEMISGQRESHFLRLSQIT
jgi:hypothetical protein